MKQLIRKIIKENKIVTNFQSINTFKKTSILNYDNYN